MIDNISRFSSVLMVCLLLTACGGSRGLDGNQRASESEALSLAVELANRECMNTYSVAPFDRTSYPIEFDDGRWSWGRLDVASLNGFSALVSFDISGRNPSVEVFLSTDRRAPAPVRRR